MNWNDVLYVISCLNARAYTHALYMYVYIRVCYVRRWNAFWWYGHCPKPQWPRVLLNERKAHATLAEPEFSRLKNYMILLLFDAIVVGIQYSLGSSSDKYIQFLCVGLALYLGLCAIHISFQHDGAHGILSACSVVIPLDCRHSYPPSASLLEKRILKVRAKYITCVLCCALSSIHVGLAVTIIFYFFNL